MELNELPNWELIEKVVGNEIGVVRFQKGATSSTGKVTKEGNMEVPVTSLDKELCELDKVDVLKIDAEGFGSKVLEGGLVALEQFQPIIMFEVHQGSDELTSLLRFLRPNYELKDLDSGELVTSDQDETNFVIATPNRRKVRT